MMGMFLKLFVISRLCLRRNAREIKYSKQKIMNCLHLNISGISEKPESSSSAINYLFTVYPDYFLTEGRSTMLQAFSMNNEIFVD